MATNKISKTKILYLLKSAKQLIGSRNERYICIAIESAGDQLSRYEKEVEYLQELISGRLDGHMTLACWLLAVYNIDPYITQKDMDKQRRTRLAWIDSLIEEFSE
jgi:hypothetical protein